MFLAKVVGKVVCTQKDPKLIGTKLLIIKHIDQNENTLGDALVTIDTVGAGINEIVIVVTGSSAKFVDSDGKTVPSDASIIGIVDSIEWNQN